MTRAMQILLVLAVVMLSASTRADYPRILRSVQQLQVLQDHQLLPWCSTASVSEEVHLWITAAHCVQDGRLFIRQQPVSVVVVSESTDLALLFSPTFAAPALKLAAHAPTVGEKIRLVGYPLGVSTPQLFQGYISSLVLHINQYGTRYGLNAAVCGGNSGTAVVNEHDEMVSLVQIGFGAPPCYAWSAGARWEDLVAILQVIQTAPLPVD